MQKKKLTVKLLNIGWWIYIANTIIESIIIKLVFNNATRETKLHFLLIYSIIELAILFIYKYLLRYVKDYPYNVFDELPLYLCNFATILAIIAAAADNQWLMAYCFSTGNVGALMALIMPDENFIEVDFFSIKSFGFYGYHSLILVSGLSFVTLGLYVPQYQDVFKVLLVSLGCLIFAHLANFILRKTVNDHANYVFTYDPGTNPVLKWFYKLIPVRMIYLIPIEIIIAVVFILFTFITRIFI